LNSIRQWSYDLEASRLWPGAVLFPAGFQRGELLGKEEYKVYTSSFGYVRAASLEQASAQLLEFGEGARPLAGGQSLIPLMKLRLSRPSALVDLNFIPGLSHIAKRDGALHIGALVRHAALEQSPAAAEIPILHDCAAGIADVQVRNRGTIGGSVAEADPSGDWVPVLLALGATVDSTGPRGRRSTPLSEFVKDAYTTALEPGELVREISVKLPSKNSGGAYLAFKRSAPVYASASAAVQLTLAGKDSCQEARIYLGCVGLTAVHAVAAEGQLRGRPITPKTAEAAAEAAMAACQPQADMRGSAEYKKLLVKHLVRRAIDAALRRCRGERVEVSHEYVARP
jgi:aerobic carbon-monoxide dehydrogenase medium subunit